ncbi:MAG: haloacid dehalogenase-like hydrolase [Phycisphaerales bacterium]|nr:haloacid dehalogenase-like hydrolase [Phycisphaerales bacterium]
MGSKIAVIFDFDGTLAPDSTSSFLGSLGVDADAFWRNSVQPLLDDGWDEMPAYLHRMLELSRARPSGDRITHKRLTAWGSQIELFPGVEAIFDTLRQTAREVDSSISVEYYLISSGIREILRKTTIAREFRDIWACRFSFDESDEIAGVRNVVSFTEKTRFIVQISKGLVGEAARGRNKAVNQRVRQGQFEIPFANMIVVGDGDTDIPMFAMVGKPDKHGRRGTTIGVSDPRSPDKWGKALRLAKDQRVETVHEADYAQGGALHATLVDAVREHAKTIASPR